jgi:hypothetical protein
MQFLDMKMEKTARFAGYYAAHGIWCLSDGGPLVPMYAYELLDGTQHMDMLVVENSGRAMEIGAGRFEKNREEASRAVLIVDAIVNDGGNRMDALIIDAVSFLQPIGKISVVVPYMPLDGNVGFKVLPAILNQVDGFNAKFSREVLVPFFEGVDSHEKGSAIWNESLYEKE